MCSKISFKRRTPTHTYFRESSIFGLVDKKYTQFPRNMSQRQPGFFMIAVIQNWDYPIPKKSSYIKNQSKIAASGARILYDLHKAATTFTDIPGSIPKNMTFIAFEKPFDDTPKVGIARYKRTHKILLCQGYKYCSKDT